MMYVSRVEYQINGLDFKGGKMKKLFGVFMLAGLFLSVLGCSGGKAPSNPESKSSKQTEIPTIQVATRPAEATPVPSPSPESAQIGELTNNCDLLDSRELAGFFSSAEVVLPTPQVSQVEQPVFSTQSAPATEVSCVFYVFHNPGSKDMVLLQVTYWLDLPDQAAPSVWSQVWTDASSLAAQAVSGTGEAAFYQDGRLSFKQGNLYVTIEAIGTQVSTQTPAGVQQQLDTEKKVALDIMGRLQ
jgi:hypothetical protein